MPEPVRLLLLKPKPKLVSILPFLISPVFVSTVTCPLVSLGLTKVRPHLFFFGSPSTEASVGFGLALAKPSPSAKVAERE
jgi:hypothetical protein